MTYKNKLGLPIPIVAWLITNEYQTREDNVISATTLLKSVKQIVLGRRYAESNKEVDVSDLIQSRMGTAIHKSIEISLERENFIKVMSEYGLGNASAIADKLVAEKRTDKEFGDYIISGQFDLAYNGYIMDIKSTSTWKYVLGDGDDYILQMSIYKWLNPDIITQDTGYICYVFTDWSSVKARQDSQYPQARIQMKEFPLMSISEIERYISDKLAMVKYHEDNCTPDDKLPDCTAKERWEKTTVYKVYGKNKTRSLKNFEKYNQAIEFMNGKPETNLVKVAGESTGCTYCAYINYCEQYQRLLSIGLIRE